MRVTIVTDVHSNLAALNAVLQQAEALRALDAIWSMGDLVGYGPQPTECLERLCGYAFRSVAGNHDLAATGGMDTRDFNRAAAVANQWNASRLTETDRTFLQALPQTLTIGQVSLVHGSLRSPAWEYLYSLDAALNQFDRMETPYSFVGHTHVPLVFEEREHNRAPRYWQPEDGELLELGDRRLIMNPGGVGQPRDGDPRAAFAIYDTEAATVAFHRVPYDIGLTQAAMREAGLPPALISRLTVGH